MDQFDAVRGTLKTSARSIKFVTKLGQLLLHIQESSISFDSVGFQFPVRRVDSAGGPSLGRDAVLAVGCCEGYDGDQSDDGGGDGGDPLGDAGHFDLSF